jgi:hypothetical protein
MLKRRQDGLTLPRNSGEIHVNDAALSHIRAAENLLDKAEHTYSTDKVIHEQLITEMNGHLSIAMLYVMLPPENPPMPGSAYL